MSVLHWVKLDEWCDADGVNHTHWNQVMYYKEQDMSDTSWLRHWIEPGMHVTTVGCGTALDGEKMLVQGRGEGYFSIFVLTGPLQSTQPKKFSADCAFRELLPKEMEAMTGKEVERQVDKARKGGDKTVFISTLPHNDWFYETYMGARQQGKTFLAAEADALRKELEQERESAEGWRRTSGMWEARTTALSDAIDTLKDKLANAGVEIAAMEAERDELKAKLAATRPDLDRIADELRHAMAEAVRERDGWKAEADRLRSAWAEQDHLKATLAAIRVKEQA